MLKMHLPGHGLEDQGALQGGGTGEGSSHVRFDHLPNRRAGPFQLIRRRLEDFVRHQTAIEELLLAGAQQSGVILFLQ